MSIDSFNKNESMLKDRRITNGSMEKNIVINTLTY